MISTKPVSALIEELNLLDESDAIEAKETSGQDVGESVYETISAFANEPGLGGGIILLGVKRDASQLFPLYRISGVKNPDKLSNDIVSACQSIFNISVRPSIKRDVIGRAIVIRIEVQELQSVQKPLYIRKFGLPRGAFRRIGSSDVRCTHDDIAAIYQSGVAKTYDQHVVANSNINDLDPTVIFLYRKFISEFNPSAEILTYRDRDLLISTSSLVDLDGKIRATATGLLTFGKAPALRRFFPAARADYLRVPGKQWIIDPDNRYVSTDLRGPAITLIDRIIASISDDLPKKFRLTENNVSRRTDDPIIPNKAIREAVVNAVMHRNYAVARPIQIIRYSNRLVIENPGYSLKAEEQFSQPGSIARNPSVAAILHETHFAETKGTGMRVMRQLLKQSGLSAPTFESDRDNDVFRVTFLFHHLFDPSEWQWLGNYDSFKLCDDELTALAFVKETGKITNGNFRAITELDTLVASKSLRRLCEYGLLEKKGGGSQTFYVAGPEMLKFVEMDGSAPIPDSALPIQDKRETLQGKPESDLLGKFPVALRSRLLHHRMGKRSDPEVLRQLIIEMCKHGPISKEDLAFQLSRDASYISQNYLSSLVKDGLISLTVPEVPQHPDQKYVAK